MLWVVAQARKRQNGDGAMPGKDWQAKRWQMGGGTTRIQAIPAPRHCLDQLMIPILNGAANVGDALNQTVICNESITPNRADQALLSNDSARFFSQHSQHQQTLAPQTNRFADCVAQRGLSRIKTEFSKR